MSATAEQTMRELLPVFYSQYNLGDDGGNSSPFVRVEFTRKLHLYFPNFDARRKAVFKHDVHHLATRYTSTFKGETEIGAWEIASGCRHYWVAWMLNLHAMMIGIVYNPAGVYRAFVRGRNTLNLYASDLKDVEILDMSIGQVRERLLLSRFDQSPPRGRLVDILVFILTLILGAVYSLLSIVLLPFIMAYTFFVLVKLRQKHTV